MVCGTDDTGVAGIQGGGTLNYLSKFTDIGTIGNSQVFDNGANVGIGTSMPNYKLDVAGNIGLTGTHLVYDSASGVIDWGSSNLYFRTLSTQGDISSYTDRATIFNDGDLWTDGCVSNYGSCQYDEGMSTYVMNTDYWYESNNDGGTIAAGTVDAELLIRGSTTFDCPSCGSTTELDGSEDWGDLTIQGRVLSANSNIHLSPPAGYNVVIDATYRAAGGSSIGPAGLLVNGNVGIGITNPAYNLDILAGGTISLNDGYLRNVKGFYLKDWDDDTGGSDSKYRLLARDGAWQFYNGGVVVGNYGNGTWSDLADGTLIVEGNVGIRDSTPSYPLDVAGDIRATGTIRGGALGRRNCAWTAEALGGDHFCPTGKYQAGWTQRIAIYKNIFGYVTGFGLYQKLYCCNP